MASVTQGNYITAKASADLSQKRYYIAKLDSNGNAALATSSGDEISGVLDDVPQAAATSGGSFAGLCSIKHISANGTGKVIAGGTIAKGAYITSDGNGKAVAATQTAGGSQPAVRVFGRARVAAVAGDVFEFEHCYFLF